MTGNFGHFFVYAPPDKGAARDYGVARYGMEVMRLTDVLNKHLATRTYLVGNNRTKRMISFIFDYQRSEFINKSLSFR
jgi:GST-like protein